MTTRFVVQRGATRVVFGAGASETIGTEVERLGATRVLVVSTAGRRDLADTVASLLGTRSVGVCAIAREHVPADVAAAGRAEADRTGADAILAVGGGSAIGLGKAIALGGRPRLFAIPTTYAGSEMTNLYGLTEEGRKRTGRDERVRPSLVVYDPALTLDLPREITVTSLFNAMAHSVEALWAAPPDPATLLGAEEGLRLCASSLPRLVAHLDDVEARESALLGAYLGGAALADGGTALHHKLCHVLGGSFGLPHAATHAVLLPHVVRFHRDSAPDAMQRIARALGVVDPVAGLEHLARAAGIPSSLTSLGFARSDVDRVVAMLLESPFDNPRALEPADLRALLEDACRDATPSASAVAPRRAASPERPAGYLHGFGATHESEALPGALPRTQNTPRHSPYGLYPELVNATPFTVRRERNARTWLYRIRPSTNHGVLSSLPSSRFASPPLAVEPNRTRWRPMPIPEAPARVDFLDGLATLGGSGHPMAGPGWSVHLYAANADMGDRCFSNADGELLVVPQQGALDCRTELGWLQVSPGEVMVVPRGLKLQVALRDGAARGYVLEVFGTSLRLPQRGPLGSNGLADERHFLAPAASFEDRACPGGFEHVTKLGGALFTTRQPHSPFDVVAWHGNHAPYKYDLALFNAMGTVNFDHPDPSIHTVLTAPLDDHGRAVCDFVAFVGRWEVAERSLRPPPMHRNAASEINGIVRTPSPSDGYEPGCCYLSPLLTAHGITTRSYDAVLDLPDDVADRQSRIPDGSLWFMFESALPFALTRWARETEILDRDFGKLFQGPRSRFDPTRP